MLRRHTATAEHAVSINFSIPLPAVGKRIVLSTRQDLPLPQSLIKGCELPLREIDWPATLWVPGDLTPGCWVDVMREAPGSPDGYVTISVDLKQGWAVDLPGVIVAPHLYWFSEAGELVRTLTAHVPYFRMVTSQYMVYQALKNGLTIDDDLAASTLRGVPQKLRDHLLRTQTRAPRRRGNKQVHDVALIVAQVWNAIDHRGLSRPQALREASERHTLTVERIRQIFARGDNGDLPVWTSAK
jgi:hypothetical protein